MNIKYVADDGVECPSKEEALARDRAYHLAKDLVENQFQELALGIKELIQAQLSGRITIHPLPTASNG